MAQVIGNKVKLSNGQLVTPQTGGWYDGQQYWNGTLSNPGQISSQSNQQGAGQMVSAEVNRQTSVAAGLAPNANQDYINKLNSTPAPQVNTPAPAPVATPTASIGSGLPGSASSLSGVPGGVSTPAAIDLPGLYKTLSNNAGISAIEQSLADKAAAYAEAQSKINDNPWLSEATRTGRIAKLSTDYNNGVKNEQDLLAMKKADIETQLNLQSKQFDINSQVAKDSLDRFNTLLKMGSLDNANGEDIANLVRSTGLSSAAIQSAIEYNKQKDVATSMVSYDDGKNQGFALVNTKTGQIISKQVVAASKPKEATGSTPGHLTAEQERVVVQSARSKVVDADTNKDKLLSAQEFVQAVQDLMIETGVTQSQADQYASQAFNDLGYKKWNW